MCPGQKNYNMELIAQETKNRHVDPENMTVLIPAPAENMLLDKTAQFINQNGGLKVSDVLETVPISTHDRISRMFSLIEPPNHQEVSSYLTNKHSVSFYPKTEIMANPCFGFCDIIHQAAQYAFDTRAEIDHLSVRQRKANAAVVDMVSNDIYSSRTYSKVLRYIYAANSAKAKIKANILPENRMVIDHLRASRTLLRRLSPWSPFVQVLLLEATSLLAAECYSTRDDLFQRISKEAYYLYTRVEKTPLLLRNDAIARSFHNTANILESKSMIQECLLRRHAALKCFKIFYYPKTDHINIAAMLSNLGLNYDQCGDKIKGIEMKELGHQMLARCHNELSERVATSLNNLGVSYQEIGYTEKGIKMQEEALNMRRLIYNNKPHEKIAQSLNNVGSALITTSKRNRGIAMLYEAIEMNHVLCQRPPYKSRALAMNHANLGSCLMHVNGKLKESKNHLFVALDMFKTHNEGHTDHENIAIAENNIGIVIEKLGNQKEGLKHKLRALQMRKKLYGESSSDSLATSLSCVGEGYLLERYHDLGLKLIMLSIDMFRNLGSSNLELLLTVSMALPQIDNFEASKLAIEYLPLFCHFIKHSSSYHRIQLIRAFSNALREYESISNWLKQQEIAANLAEIEEQALIRDVLNADADTESDASYVSVAETQIYDTVPVPNDFSIHNDMIIEFAFLNKYLQKKYVAEEDTSGIEHWKLFKNNDDNCFVVLDDKDICDARRIFDDPISHIKEKAGTINLRAIRGSLEFDFNKSPTHEVNLEILESVI